MTEAGRVGVEHRYEGRSFYDTKESDIANPLKRKKKKELRGLANNIKNREE